MLSTVHLILSLFAVVATFITTVNWRVWIIYTWRAQRQQIGVLALILAAAVPWVLHFSTTTHILIISILVIAALYNFYIIFPFTPLADKELKDASGSQKSFSLVSSNVRMSNEDYHLLKERIDTCEADVVLLLEVDQKWLDELQELEKDFPYTCLCPQDNTYGMALYSKFPFEQAEARYLIEDNVPSIHALLNFNDQTVIQFLGLHPRPPAPWTKEEHKDYELLTAARETNFNDHPTVVAGDLNDVAWSPVTNQFKSISKLKDPRVGRGFFRTYNVHVPLFRMPIDHCFVSDHFTIAEIRRLPNIGSDHFPIFIKLNLA